MLNQWRNNKCEILKKDKSNVADELHPTKRCQSCLPIYHDGSKASAIGLENLTPDVTNESVPMLRTTRRSQQVRVHVDMAHRVGAVQLD